MCDASVADSRRHWLVLVPLALAIGMVGIDASIVSVANATIARDLHASLADLQWITDAYLLALCALLLNAGRIADRIGRKRVFLAGTGAFALASAGCALAGSTGELIAWRAVQGVAGAMLMPSSLALLRASFDEAELDRAVAVWAGVATASVVAGPILGGLLVEHVSWQSVFLINLPVALLAIAGAQWLIGESREAAAGRALDLVGSALASTCLVALVFALIKAPARGWGSAYTLGMLAAAAVLFVAFVARESATREPMLPLGLFRSRALTAATCATVMTYFALYGVLFFWTLYLQRVLGDSPVTSGVHLLPLTFGFVASMPLAGFVGTRFGLRVSLFLGLLGIAAGSVWLTGVAVRDGYGAVWPPFLLVGVSLAMAAVAGIQTMMSNAPVRFAGTVGGVMTTACQLGGVLGISVLGSVIAAHGATAFVGGVHAAMWVSAAVALAGALLAPFIRRGTTEVGAAPLG
jgi:EmrB/QacA subfamily drug resistance transporter